MKFVLSGRSCRPDNGQLLEDLRAFAAECGREHVSYKEYMAAGRFYPTIFVRRFGSWNGALAAAGLCAKRVLYVPGDVLLEHLRQLWVALGRQPVMADLRPPLSRYGRKPYERVFGSWKNALSVMVDVVNGSTSGAAIAEWENGSKDVLGCGKRGSGERKSNKPKVVGWRLRHLVMKRDLFRCVGCGASPAKMVGVELVVVPCDIEVALVADNLKTVCRECDNAVIW